VAASGSATTLATWYAWTPPWTCWDAAGAHSGLRTPTGQIDRYFVAMRGVPCGTPVTVEGPAGTVRARIWDHGPNCDCPERGIDASAQVFLDVAGSLGSGVVRVAYSLG